MLQEHHRSYKLIPSIGLAMFYPVHGENISVLCAHFIFLGWVSMAPDNINLSSLVIIAFKPHILSLTVGKSAISQFTPLGFVSLYSTLLDMLEVFDVLKKVSHKPGLSKVGEA